MTFWTGYYFIIGAVISTVTIGYQQPPSTHSSFISITNVTDIVKTPTAAERKDTDLIGYNVY